MKHKLLSLFVLTLLLAGTAAAQIVIDESDLGGLFDINELPTVFEATNPSAAQPLADMTGANQTFNFMNMTFEEQELDGVFFSGQFAAVTGDEPGVNLPAFDGAEFYSMVTIEVEGLTSTSYSYYLRQDGDLALLGSFSISPDPTGGPDIEVVTSFDPPRIFFSLPMRFGDTFSYAGTQTTNFGGQEFTSAISEEQEVDAWGTLITPAGSADALRLRTDTQTESFGIVSNFTSISYYTKVGLFASLGLDGDGNVTSASYWTIDFDGGTTAVEPLPGEVPSTFALGQNYPNPFNPATTIPFHLAQAGPVKVTVFNTLGQAVAVLADEVLPAGNYVTDWQAEGFPSGVYLYRLEVDGRTLQTRRMVLQK